MIMRKFHNSMAVGFFMGVTVASSQLFAALALVYVGYGKDQVLLGGSAKEETIMAVMASVQAILLGSFAAILAAHRTEILDKQGEAEDASYEPPPPQTGATTGTLRT